MLKNRYVNRRDKREGRKRREHIGFICSPLIYIVGRRDRKKLPLLKKYHTNEKSLFSIKGFFLWRTFVL
ncbi:hypothetical protein BMWSH_1683 [Priestia megaterium WSH-002]|uniref:Uncharacterized protein n=1 Tax=Priestia megaterium (strain WSH-002) TaxID=1006007 RepID=A0A8D3WYT0_PRIMW|nr:hypothetical protein BMWSH_1683 [Priestia megaterium WSH-002]QDZ79479.1 hypothetical protein D0440_08610 [Priestia megaterium]